MVTHETFRALALALPDTEAHPHFERSAFKIRGKRIYATLHEESATVNLKLSPEDQAAFATFGKGAVYAVPNKWGLQGWTTFVLKKVTKTLIKDALQCAYDDVVRAKGRR